MHAPFVAAHRLSHDLASNDPMRWWLGWQSVALEKWLVGAQAMLAASTAALALGPRSGAAAVDRIADATLAPIARRVRGNAAAIRRRRAR